MAEPQSGVRIFSLDEANMLLPLVRSELLKLRKLRKSIVASQALVDIEEIAGPPAEASRSRIASLLASIEADVMSFHRVSEELHATGCELKDLDRGLVDFYGMRGNDVIYLCWMEGEESITHWHTLNAGFKGRQPIED